MKKILKINTLLVDDEPHILKKVRKVIESTFEDFIIVGEMKNGYDALETIKNGHIDLVITDIRMPEMSGLELAEVIRMNHPQIKTIILTGHSEFEYAKKAIQLNVVDFILKPIAEDTIIKVLAKLLVTFSNERNEDIHLPSSSTLGAEETFELVKQYIKENHLQNITLAEIATKFNFSQAYLTKIFIKFTGMPPLKYKTSLRISAAKDYLIKTNMTVADVAERLGYSDQFAFSKAFKKSEKLSPLQYRKSLKPVD